MSAWPAWHLLGGAPYQPSYATDLRERFREEKRRIEFERRERERREADESANDEDADGR